MPTLCILQGKASAETEACSGSSLLLAVKDLAPSCIAACPDICPHLETLIMQALMNIDPLPYVCANSATFLCMDTTACDSLLDTAESYNLFHVPRSEQELQDACNPPDTSSTAAPSTSQEETEPLGRAFHVRALISHSFAPEPSNALRLIDGYASEIATCN
ncbi:unnamed protein product [Symbiodinium pilosum]|uniref:Uncharacterized protein n=1 Tax=Symbiodinium pilosum TaxID=2952 RepID=A0A812LWQ0_SYMPI|nr:unnamed protein product [Symbiodinium pilosum]